MSFRFILDRIARIARAEATSWGTAAPLEKDPAMERFDEELKRAERARRGEAEEQGGERNGAKAERPRHSAEHIRASQRLGVPVDAGFDDITAAYRKRIILLHPDRMAGKSVEEIEWAKRATQELNEAYAYMKRHHRRA